MELTEQSIEEMFDGDAEPGIMDMMQELAEVIAVGDDQCKKLDKELKNRKEKLENVKQQLHELMTENGCKEGHKFDNGLYLKPYVRTDIFKAAGVTDDQLFAWLRQNELGGIIKEAVW